MFKKNPLYGALGLRELRTNLNRALSQGWSSELIRKGMDTANWMAKMCCFTWPDLV